MPETIRAKYIASIIFVSSNIHMILIFMYSKEYHVPFFAAVNFFSVYGIIFTTFLVVLFTSLVAFTISPSLSFDKDVLRRISNRKIKSTNENIIDQFKINLKTYSANNGIGIITTIILVMIIIDLSTDHYANYVYEIWIYIIAIIFMFSVICINTFLNKFRNRRKIRRNIIGNIISKSITIPISYIFIFVVTLNIITNDSYIGPIINQLKVYPIISSLILSSVLMLCVSFHSSMSIKDSALAACLLLLIILISNHNISTSIVRNTLKAVNSGGGLPVEITTLDLNTKKFTAELITDKGIFATSDDAKIIFIDAKSYTFIKYLKEAE